MMDTEVFVLLLLLLFVCFSSIEFLLFIYKYKNQLQKVDNGSKILPFHLCDLCTISIGNRQNCSEPLQRTNKEIC